MADPIVAVKQGQLKGTIDTDLDGQPFYKFKGIPYAQPPVGPLRFKVCIQFWVFNVFNSNFVALCRIIFQYIIMCLYYFEIIQISIRYEYFEGRYDIL